MTNQLSHIIKPDTILNTKNIVQDYFNSWRNPEDLSPLESILHEEFSLDNGLVSFDSKKLFLEHLRKNHSAWKKVELISEIYSENEAAILYKGIVTPRNSVLRVSEHIKLKDDKIFRVESVLSQP